MRIVRPARGIDERVSTVHGRLVATELLAQVPLEHLAGGIARQLRDVLDPLTAAFMSVQSNAPAGDLAVCDRTLRVFDGKQRFDLTLSPKRTEQLGAGAPDGLPDTAAVCRVAYKPIGGYRRETYAVQFLQESDGIEAWLVPVEGTGLYVPYKVIVPTTWGDGALKLTGIEARPSSPQRASAR